MSGPPLVPLNVRYLRTCTDTYTRSDPIFIPLLLKNVRFRTPDRPADYAPAPASLTGNDLSWLTNVDATHVGSPASSMFG